MSRPIPTEPPAVPAATPVATGELRTALERALAEPSGRVREVRELRRRRSAYRTSFALEELDVALEDGTSLELIFKNLGRESLEAAGRLAKPGFLHDSRREIEVYRRLLAPASLGTATYHGSVADAGSGRYWLFLERVAGVELYQVGEIARWEDAARWLGTLHSRFAGEVDRCAAAGRLVRHDAPYFRCWIERALEFARGAGRPRHEFDTLAWLAARYDGVVECLHALPTTVIHGEFYASNVLVLPAAGATRVCPVDWEVAAAGSGLIDLAALSEGWDPPVRERLARAYRGALRGEHFRWDGLDDLARALDLCRLHLAVQWLGWAPPGWSPPAEHRRDWLATALRLAEELGV